MAILKHYVLKNKQKIKLDSKSWTKVKISIV